MRTVYKFGFNFMLKGIKNGLMKSVQFEKSLKQLKPHAKKEEVSKMKSYRISYRVADIFKCPDLYLI